VVPIYLKAAGSYHLHHPLAVGDSGFQVKSEFKSPNTNRPNDLYPVLRYSSVVITCATISCFLARSGGKYTAKRSTGYEDWEESLTRRKFLE